MGIDVRVANTVPTPRHARVTIEERHFAYLCAAFDEVARVTGVAVALYDHVAYSGHQLKTLEAELKKTARTLRHQPESWQILLGWTLVGEGRKRMQSREETITRAELATVLGRLLKVVRAAHTRSAVLEFVGD